jgi:hypothetical protein
MDRWIRSAVVAESVFRGSSERTLRGACWYACKVFVLIIIALNILRLWENQLRAAQVFDNLINDYIFTSRQVGSCQHNIVHPQVADGETASRVAGSCAYIEKAVADSQQVVVLQLGGWARC